MQTHGQVKLKTFLRQRLKTKNVSTYRLNCLKTFTPNEFRITKLFIVRYIYKFTWICPWITGNLVKSNSKYIHGGRRRG